MATPQWYCFLLLLPVYCTAYLRSRKIGEPNYEILFFEYGTHIKGQQVSFAYNGAIPALTPIYHLSIMPKRADLEKKFTYLRVEYVSPMSKVSININPKNNTLTFYVRFPFIDIPIGIVGYSMPLIKGPK